MEKSKTSNRYSAEVRSRAVRMVLEEVAPPTTS
jgi:transposase-like protein